VPGRPRRNLASAGAVSVSRALGPRLGAEREMVLLEIVGSVVMLLAVLAFIIVAYVGSDKDRLS
jgi:hypothetical protein